MNNLSTIDIKPIQPIWAKDILDLAKDEIVELAKVPSFSNQTDVLKWMEEIAITTNQYSYAIIHNKFGFIGAINLAIIKASGYLSYWLGKPYWGKGYATLAIQKILKTAFSEFEISHIFAGVLKNNFRSIKLLKKFAFAPIETQNHQIYFFQKSRKKISQTELEKKLNYILIALNIDINVNK